MMSDEVIKLLLQIPLLGVFCVALYFGIRIMADIFQKLAADSEATRQEDRKLYSESLQRVTDSNEKAHDSNAIALTRVGTGVEHAITILGEKIALSDRQQQRRLEDIANKLSVESRPVNGS